MSHPPFLNSTSLTCSLWRSKKEHSREQVPVGIQRRHWCWKVLGFIPCVIVAFIISWSYYVHLWVLLPQEWSYATGVQNMQSSTTAPNSTAGDAVHTSLIPPPFSSSSHFTPPDLVSSSSSYSSSVPSTLSQPEWVLSMIALHLFLLLFMVSYAKTVFISPGSTKSTKGSFADFVKSTPLMTTIPVSPSQVSPTIPPPEGSSKEPEAGALSDASTCIDMTSQPLSQFITVKQDGSQRFCRKCQIPKPDRSHHCSVCQKCILKMDHHCPWVNNCVGYRNQKFFFLFLMWGACYCILTSILSLKVVTRDLSTMMMGQGTLSPQITLLAFASTMFSLALTPFCLFHGYLICTNRTTIENMERQTRMSVHGQPRTEMNPNWFDLGIKNNWKQVMGNSPCLWLLPVYTTLGNGFIYPLRKEEEHNEPIPLLQALEA